MKNKIIQIFLLGLLSACFGNKNSIETTVPLSCDINKVEIPLDKTYYDSITSHISDTSFVILNEKNNIMFSYIDKIIEYIETAPKKYAETGKSPIVQIIPIAKSLRMYFICINLSLPCTQS